MTLKPQRRTGSQDAGCLNDQDGPRSPENLQKGHDAFDLAGDERISWVEEAGEQEHARTDEGRRGTLMRNARGLGGDKSGLSEGV